MSFRRALLLLIISILLIALPIFLWLQGRIDRPWWAVLPGVLLVVGLAILRFLPDVLDSVDLVRGLFGREKSPQKPDFSEKSDFSTPTIKLKEVSASAGSQITVVGGDYIDQRRPDAPPPDLEAALAKLAAMPAGPEAPIPPQANLPAGSRMPYPPNPHFVGREAALKGIAASLKGEGSAAVIGQTAAISGLGGIGKSQLAAEFAHRYGQYFGGGVFWLNFAEPDGVSSEIAACAGAVGDQITAQAFDQLPQPQRLKLVLTAWQAALPRLLIFDNCDRQAEGLLQRWRPTTGGCRVLVTSHHSHWDAGLGLTARHLETLTPAESARLLQGLAAHLAEAEARKIAAALGRFPLALHLAGSYLATYAGEVSSAAYLQEIEARPLAHPSLTGERGSRYSPTEHERHVGRTFGASWARLGADNPIDQLARRMARHAAHFAPGVPIPDGLLKLTLETKTSSWSKFIEAIRRMFRLSTPGISDLDFADARRRLVNLGLATAPAGGLQLHRLVAAFVRGQAAAQTATAARTAVENGLIAEASRLNRAGYPAALRQWAAHLRHVTDAALPREDETAARLANELGYHLQADGNYAAARPYYAEALAIRKQVLGAQHPDTAQSLNNMGALLQAMGEYAAARPYFAEALAISKQVLGAQHPDTATSLNNMGALLQAMGEYAAARPYYAEALAINKQVLGAQHPDTATSLNNMGYLLHLLGEYAAARPYYTEALAIRKQVLGAQHPATATSLNNMGYLLHSLGEYAAARPYYAEALAIRKQVLGAQHPDTATSLNNMGYLLRALGEYEAVRPYFAEALAIWEEKLGPNHPLTKIARGNLESLDKS